MPAVRMSCVAAPYTIGVGDSPPPPEQAPAWPWSSASARKTTTKRAAWRPTLTLMSERILEEAARGELSPEEARAIMLAVAADQIATLKRAALADRSRSQPEPMSGARADRVLGAAYRLLAERGRAATLGPQDDDLLSACGWRRAKRFKCR